MCRDTSARRERRGMALIEALIGLVLLGTVGASLLMLLGQTRASIHAMRTTEEVTDSASAALEQMVTENRAGLLRRVGWTLTGNFALHVELVAPSLFDVEIARVPGERPLVSTTLYRLDSADVQ